MDESPNRAHAKPRRREEGRGKNRERFASSTVALTVVPPRLSNLSVRSTAGTGDQTLIVGFVVAVDGQKQALIRGVGPSLAQFA